jgi:hypothetical protein
MLAVTSTRNESHVPIRVGWDGNESQIVYRELDNLRAIAVNKGDCEIICEFAEIKINQRIVSIYRLNVDSCVGQWETLEDLTGIFTPRLQ